MMSAIPPGSGSAMRLPRMETGALERAQRGAEEGKALIEARNRKMEEMMAANAGKGAASAAYRMAQILGAPPEELRMLKSG